MDKATLRQLLRQKRNALDAATRQQFNQAFTQHCIDYLHTRSAEHIAVYLKQDGEVDLSEFITWLWQSGKYVYLPKIGSHRQLSFVPYTSNSPLLPNRYGILEPIGEHHPVKLDIIFSPLVAYDRQGHRLGMGGGFYDATLKALNPRPLFIGCAYALQLCDNIPHEPWDIRLDSVINEQAMFSF